MNFRISGQKINILCKKISQAHTPWTLNLLISSRKSETKTK